MEPETTGASTACGTNTDAGCHTIVMIGLTLARRWGGAPVALVLSLTYSCHAREAASSNAKAAVSAAAVAAAPGGHGSDRAQGPNAVEHRPHAGGHKPRPRSLAASPLSDAGIDWNRNAVMRTLGAMAANLTTSRYVHGISVNKTTGSYFFDCSGLVQWVLLQAEPRAAAAARAGLSHRPLARDFYRRIASVPEGAERRGWRRVLRVRDIEPGDVIAWTRPRIVRSSNTGHVGFALRKPVLAPGYENAYLVRIADSTSLLHADDTRVGRTGFGFGTILLVTDQAGKPTAYGWVALQWRAFETRIAIGRPTS